MRIEYIKLKSTNQVIIKNAPYGHLINDVHSSNGASTEHSEWTLFDFPEILTVSAVGNKELNKEKSKFTLKNPELASKDIPLELSYADVGTMEREYIYEFPYEWENHDGIRPLYEEDMVYDEPENEDVDFELSLVMELDALPDYKNFKFTKGRMGYNDYDTLLCHRSVIYYLSNRIAVPEVLLGLTSCALDTKDSMQIVRHWVKLHIDPKVARVTSDYDFTFTVAKVLPNVVKTPYQVDVSTGRQKPRFQTRYKDNDLIPDFFNIDSGHNQYNKNMIKFRGDNLQDLHDNIQTYLDELMEQINAPVHMCDHCEGNGTVVQAFEPVTTEGVE